MGDSELNFLFIGYLTYTPNQTKLIEYLDDRVTTMNVPPMPPTVSPNCATYYCTSSVYSTVISPQPGYSAIVGQACEYLNIPFSLSVRILYLFYKFGVFLGCNISIEKKCVDGFWAPVCPM